MAQTEPNPQIFVRFFSMIADTFPRHDPALDIGLVAGNSWHRFISGEVILWAKGYLIGEGFEHLANRLAAHDSLDETALGDILLALDGHWALAATGRGWAFAAVDRIRSIPLIWARAGAEVIVDQDSGRTARRLDLTETQIDTDAALAVGLAGYTIGDDTLYPKVRQIGPGGFLFVDESGVETPRRYHRWTPWLPDDVAPDDLVAPLGELHQRLIDKLIAGANGRSIAVPLSAGLDSRFVAAGLRAAGYDNVICFAYGLPDNREAAISRVIAKRLGYPWHFVKFSNRAMRRAMASDDHAAFRASADSLTGIHFPQDYLALRQLRDNGAIGPDSIMVNGQSGDFITGNHIPNNLLVARHDRAPAARRKAVIDALLARHFKQWAHLQTPDNFDRLARRLGREIDAIGMPHTASGDHGIYEYCEFQDRQSKYVVGGQRVYEHFGLEWRLPLWDQDYLDFWARAPLVAKAHQQLYRRVLEKQNWGGVWRDDIPVNPTRIRPHCLRFARLGFKALHAPLGRERWHAFERRYLTYFMTPICAFAIRPWHEVAFDGRGHMSAIAYYNEDYLAEKGFSLNGLAG